MKVLMLGNGFDLYHYLLSHYDDFMTICEYLSQKYHVFSDNDLKNKNIYSELFDLIKTNETIREKVLVYKEAYQKTTIDENEYKHLLESLKSNCWFKHFLNIKRRDGWVALENEVKETLNEFKETSPKCIDAFLDAVRKEDNLSEAFMKHAKDYIFRKGECDSLIFDHYNKFIEILKLYLKIFVNDVLNNICNIYTSLNKHYKDSDFVLTFNYTNTYEKLYNANTNIIHIHGDLNNEIVLGVNSDENDIEGVNDSRFIKYKKYYQRITKHTFLNLGKLIYRIKTTHFEENGLFVIGHSLDISDGDIITVLFELFDIIVIYYLDDGALDKYVRNLKLIFGAEKLSQMTFSQKIIFSKIPDNEYSCVIDSTEL